MSRVILSYGTSLQIFHLKSDFYNIIFHLKSTFFSQGRLESNTKCFRNNHVLRAENFASARKKTVPYEKCEFCRLMTEDWYIYVNFRWNNYKWMLLINVQFLWLLKIKTKYDLDSPTIQFYSCKTGIIKTFVEWHQMKTAWGTCISLKLQAFLANHNVRLNCN